MADSTKRQDREVTSTAKQDKKGFKVPRIPGDIMLYPLLVGLLLNSFCPQVLAVGSFTTAVVKGSSTIVGLLLIFMGASINLRAVPEALKTGVVVLVPKLALSIALGLGVAAFCGNNFFGLSALSIIGGIAFCNVALYSGIMTEYGDSGEQGATALLALTAGPTITMLALGVSGLADIKPLVYVGTLLPLVLGIIMGNASPFLKNLLVPGINPCIAVVGFSLGCGMSLEQRCLPANCPKVLSPVRERPRHFALIERYSPKWVRLIARIPESLHFLHIRSLPELPAKHLSRAVQQQETVAGLFEILYQSRCAAWVCSFSNLYIYRLNI